MPRMLDLIRNSQVPSNLMHSAAHGSLSVPAEETLEILVYLALHHQLFGEQARLTLAGWDEKASLTAASDPKTSSEVLGYFVAQENLRPVLLLALAENPSAKEEALDALAVSGSHSTIETLLTSPRVMHSPHLLQALQSNPNLRPNELIEIQKMLAGLNVTPAESAHEEHAPDEVLEIAVHKFLEENAAELEAEKDRPFNPIGIALDDTDHQRTIPAVGIEPAAVPNQSLTDVIVTTLSATADSAAKPATVAAVNTVAAAAAPHAPKPPLPAHVPERRDSTLHKISKLDIRGRITLAMRGSKEERSILIRDSTKLVAIAVLESPKVTEGEVENFALQKNVLESVLRAIPMKRKFAKNYNIMRNLVCNPRTPLDLSLGLMKNLLVHDLKNLSGNKEVPDTIRKLALRMFKQKLEKKN
jgi:hypothetical protein